MKDIKNEMRISPPEEGIESDEESRLVIDMFIGMTPMIGGALEKALRYKIPSLLDKRRKEWEKDVSNWVNESYKIFGTHETRIKMVEAKYENISDSVQLMQKRVEKLEKIVEMDKNSGIGAVAEDPLDGELEICRSLISNEQFETALNTLRERFDERDNSNPIRRETIARVRSLQAVCLKNLRNYEASAEHFQQAFDLDPENTKIRANAAVGFLISGKFDQAELLIKDLLEKEMSNELHWANFIYLRNAQGKNLDINEIPIEIRQKEDILIALIVAMRTRGDLFWREQAKICKSRFPDSLVARRHGAEAILEEFAEVHQTQNPNPRTLTAIFEQVGQAATELHRQWLRHKDSEVGKVAPDLALLQNTIIAFRLAGKSKFARELIDENFELILTDNDARVTAGLTALSQSQGDLADRVLATRFDGDAPLRLERAVQKKQWRDAAEILNLYPEELVKTGMPNPDRYRAMLEAMIVAPEKQAEAFRKAFEDYPENDGHADLLLSRLSAEAGQSDISEQAFERAQSVVDAEGWAFRSELASEAAKRDKNETVINLLQDYVDVTQDSAERKGLALAHARTTPPRASGIDFFSKVREHAQSDAIIQLAGGSFHMKRRMPREAMPWLQRAYSLAPNDPGTQQALWGAFIENGREEEAKQLLMGIDVRNLEGHHHDRLRMAVFLSRLGRKEALDYAYEIACRHGDEPEICLAYAALFLPGSVGEIAIVPEAEYADVGVWVKLSRNNGLPLEFVISETNDGVPFHRQKSDPIASAAMGKRRGEKFETKIGLSRSVWTVEDILPKYVYLFREFSTKFQDSFPNKEGIYSIHIKEDDFTALNDFMKERKIHSEEIDSLYQKNHIMSLGAAAKLKNVSVMEFARHLFSSKKQIVVSIGGSEEIASEKESAKIAQEKGVVLDNYTAWLLAELDLINATKITFSRVLIPMSTIDEISKMIEELNLSRDGMQKMGYEQGTLVLHEVSKENVANYSNYLSGVRDKLHSKTEVVGIECPEHISEKMTQLSDFMGEQADAISVGKREEVALLSADLRLRHIGKDLFQMGTFGMDTLLATLLKEGNLSESDYSKAILILCELGHYHVSLNPGVLGAILDIDQTLDLSRFESVAKQFGGPNADIASHIFVAARASKLMFHKAQRLEDRIRAQKATSLMLRSLVRFPNASLKDIVGAFMRVADNEQINLYVVNWLRGHFLMDNILQSLTPDREEGKSPERSR